jgi:hypothetical protein
MDRGKAMMEGATAVRYQSALEVFEQAARLAPSFAEVCLLATAAGQCSLKAVPAAVLKDC